MKDCTIYVAKSKASFTVLLIYAFVLVYAKGGRFSTDAAQ